MSNIEIYLHTQVVAEVHSPLRAQLHRERDLPLPDRYSVNEQLCAQVFVQLGSPLHRQLRAEAKEL